MKDTLENTIKGLRKIQEEEYNRLGDMADQSAENAVAWLEYLDSKLPHALVIQSVIAALEHPIQHVWPDKEETGSPPACYTPYVNPTEMLVVVDGNKLIGDLKAVVENADGLLKRCEATWNACYPDRKPWSEIGAGAQQEWMRVFGAFEQSGKATKPKEEESTHESTRFPESTQQMVNNEQCSFTGVGRWWKRPLRWLLGHDQRRSPDKCDEFCRRAQGRW